MDVLTDVLYSLRLKGSLYCRSELSAPWALPFLKHEAAVFHVVERGECWLKLDDEPAPLRLSSGDVVLLPLGTAHQVGDAPTSPPFPPVYMDYDAYRECQRWHPNHPGPATVLLCGTFHFEHNECHPLLTLLPKLIHIPGEQGRAVEALDATLKLMSREAESSRPGAQLMLRRLADVLFVQVIRDWVEQQSDCAAGWLGALRDQQIGAALSAIHQQPARAWTVATLASEVAMSRSAFAARFMTLVGEPPLQYLTRWRMNVAARLLSEAELHMSEVASRVGYESAVTFSKAFKRQVGIAPGAYRRGARHERN